MKKMLLTLVAIMLLGGCSAMAQNTRTVTSSSTSENEIALTPGSKFTIEVAEDGTIMLNGKEMGGEMLHFVNDDGTQTVRVRTAGGEGQHRMMRTVRSSAPHGSHGLHQSGGNVFIKKVIDIEDENGERRVIVSGGENGASHGNRVMRFRSDDCDNDDCEEEIHLERGAGESGMMRRMMRHGDGGNVEIIVDGEDMEWSSDEDHNVQVWVDGDDMAHGEREMRVFVNGEGMSGHDNGDMTFFGNGEAPHGMMVMDRMVGGDHEVMMQFNEETMQLEKETHELAMKIRHSEDDAEKAELETQLDAKLAELFAAKLALTEEHLSTMSEHMATKQKDLTERRSNQAEIIARRKAQLLGDRDPLKW